MAIKEEEIRPASIFDEYLKLTEQDTKFYFGEAKKEDGLCPACESRGEYSFTKQGFEYECCANCQTLFVNPRPVLEAFNRYYTESPSSKYWATTFYKETAEARREKLWKPKALLVKQIIERYGEKGATIFDIGGGYGIFAEEMKKIVDCKISVIEPGPHLAEACRQKNIPVIQKFLEDVTSEELGAGIKVFVSFELFEHLHEPKLFLNQLKKLMSPGDIFIFTTLSGTGVDIQALWENSKSVSPPHHLNFLNPKSVTMLLEKTGLKVKEVTTPGKLDIDIMYNSRHLIKDHFWKTFLTLATEEERNCWQNFISTNGWSSHMMIVCKKESN